MKTIKFYVIISSLLFITASCIENSDKYKAVVAQRDSLNSENKALDSNYNKIFDILNDVEAGFLEITESQIEMRDNLNTSEGQSMDKKQRIAAQMKSIKDNFERNKSKIAELQRLFSKNKQTNNLLTETIKRLQNESTEKDKQIQSLKTELEKRNIKIGDFNTKVKDQSLNIAELQSAMEQQKTTFNTVWFCVATYKELKAAMIITNTGLFRSKKVMAVDFDNKTFTQADLRTISSITTDSKRIRFITSHPQSSYNLVTDDDKKIIIEITDPSKFWSISKYLVVRK